MRVPTRSFDVPTILAEDLPLDSDQKKGPGREMKVQKLLKIILPIGLICFVMLSLFSYWVFHAQQLAIEAERRAIEVQAGVSDIYQALQAAELAQQGFLISGQQSYKVSYDSALAELKIAMSRFKDKISYFPYTQTAVGSLELTIREKLEELKWMVVLGKGGKQNEAQDIFINSRGQQLMLKIRRSLDEIDLMANREAQKHEVFVERYSSALNRVLDRKH